MKPYKFYKFKGQDPMVSQVLRTLGNQSMASTSKESGVSASTLANWRKKKTSRPQFATMQAVAMSRGYKLKLVRDHD